MAERLTYTAEEVATLAGVGRRLLYESAARGEIPGQIRIGRRLVFSRFAIHQWLGTGHDNGTKDGELITGASPLSDSEQEAPPHGEHGSSG